MAHPRMTDQELFDQLATADRDQLRLILEHGIQRLIEIEASAVIGADPYERAADRATHRNGHRPKPLDTGVGRLELQIPKLRMGSFVTDQPNAATRDQVKTGHPRSTVMVMSAGLLGQVLR